MLDARLRRIAELVEPGSRLVDIGSDHARLPVWLVRSGRCPRAIATDVRRGPLENARRHVEEAGLSDRIELRLGDGLQPVRPGEGDVFVIAGMGGGTIAQILAAAGWAQDPALLWLLQPMTKPELLRKYLYQNGFRIEREWIVPDGPHDYPVLCVRGGAVCGADLRAADERNAHTKCELCDAGDPVKWVLGEVRLPEGERYLRRQCRRFEKQLHGLRCLLAAGNAAGDGAAALCETDLRAADEPSAKIKCELPTAGEAAAPCETDLRAADEPSAKIKCALPRCPALSTSRQRERCLGKSACRPLEGTAVALRATRVFADGANPGGTPCQSPTAAATRADAGRRLDSPCFAHLGVEQTQSVCSAKALPTAGEAAAPCETDLRAADEPSAKIKCELPAAGGPGWLAEEPVTPETLERLLAAIDRRLAGAPDPADPAG